MESKDLIKWALIAAAAYLAYKVLFGEGGMFAQQRLTAPPPPPADKSTDAATKATDQTKTETKTNGSAQLSLHDTIAQAAANDAFQRGGKMEFERWSYYYHQTTQGQANPIPGVDLSTVGIDGAVPITLDEWWAAASKLITLSGLYRTQLAGVRPSRWGAY